MMPFMTLLVTYSHFYQIAFLKSKSLSPIHTYKEEG